MSDVGGVYVASIPPLPVSVESGPPAIRTRLHPYHHVSCSPDGCRLTCSKNRHFNRTVPGHNGSHR